MSKELLKIQFVDRKIKTKDVALVRKIKLKKQQKYVRNN